MQVEVNTIESSEKVKNSACGCGSGGCGSHSKSHNNETFNIELPSRFQLLQEGDRVVELGSGTGNDCISAAGVVGPKGKVIGIDISEKNINTSRATADSLKVSNVEFRLGNIEDVPLPDEYANVIYASCVFNLQINKQRVADEMYRVDGEPPGEHRVHASSSTERAVEMSFADGQPNLPVFEVIDNK